MQKIILAGKFFGGLLEMNSDINITVRIEVRLAAIALMHYSIKQKSPHLSENTGYE